MRFWAFIGAFAAVLLGTLGVAIISQGPVAQAQNLLPGSGSSFVSVAAMADASDQTFFAASPNRRLTGFTCTESAGTPAVATVKIYNGTSAVAAQLITEVELAANSSAREWWFPGIRTPDGIFVEVTAGLVDVQVYSLVF